MKRNLWIGLIFILLLTASAFVIDWPNSFNIGFLKNVKMHEGLDLRGGTHLVYELDLSKIDKKDTENAIQSVTKVMNNRVNFLGVSEATIQTASVGDKKSVIVELPGITDVNEAVGIIGKTAQLEFWELNTNNTNTSTENVAMGWKPTELNGSHLKKAEVKFDQQTGEPEVAIEFNDQGKKLFADITKRNLQKPLAIVLDNVIMSAPTVQTAIEDGQAVITGKFTIPEAKNLANILNAGALPVPVNLIEQRNIGATLGFDSVKASLLAGFVGIILIALFMISYYKFPGILAVIALSVYTLIVIAIFKLVPVTLTLAGIAGFILSIGMAVDANILVFERMKEELRSGKTLGASVDEGFKRAWLSIRDSNFSSLITCAILYFTTTGLVKGFAVTLALGILVSLFTAITVTRTFLKLTVGTKLEKIMRIA
jgi:preprotein translocase subunit SecD